MVDKKDSFFYVNGCIIITVSCSQSNVVVFLFFIITFVSFTFESLLTNMVMHYHQQGCYHNRQTQILFNTCK